MRVIFDTNVLISAALKDKNPEKVILFVVQHPDFDWIITPEILEEYKGVFKRDKFGNTTILSVSLFKKIVCDVWTK